MPAATARSPRQRQLAGSSPLYAPMMPRESPTMCGTWSSAPASIASSCTRPGCRWARERNQTRDGTASSWRPATLLPEPRDRSSGSISTRYSRLARLFPLNCRGCASASIGCDIQSHPSINRLPQRPRDAGSTKHSNNAGERDLGRFACSVAIAFIEWPKCRLTLAPSSSKEATRQCLPRHG